jgi:hypothetical protein
LPAELTAIQIGLTHLVLVLTGMTKGVLGVGRPLVEAPLLSQIVPVPLAIMTFAVSIVVSNGFRALQGGNIRPYCVASGRCSCRSWPLGSRARGCGSP